MIIPKLLSSLDDFKDPMFIEILRDVSEKFKKKQNQKTIDELETFFTKPNYPQYIEFSSYDTWRERYNMNFFDDNFNLISAEEHDITFHVDIPIPIKGKIINRDERFDSYKSIFPDNQNIISNIENNIKPELEVFPNYGFDVYNNYSLHTHGVLTELTLYYRNINRLHSQLHSLLEQKFVLQLEDLFNKNPIECIDIGAYEIQIKLKKGQEDLEKKEKFLNHFFTQEYIKNFRITVYEKEKFFVSKHNISGDKLSDRIEGFKSLLNTKNSENHQLFLFTLLTNCERKNILNNIEKTLDGETFKNLSKRRI